MILNIIYGFLNDCTAVYTKYRHLQSQQCAASEWFTLSVYRPSSWYWLILESFKRRSFGAPKLFTFACNSSELSRALRWSDRAPEARSTHSMAAYPLNRKRLELIQLQKAHCGHHWSVGRNVRTSVPENTQRTWGSIAYWCRHNKPSEPLWHPEMGGEPNENGHMPIRVSTLSIPSDLPLRVARRLSGHWKWWLVVIMKPKK